ncbi:EI24 domain-containing protein [Streptomyces sp. MS06]|uniref:EI24 domain-containing protein n=1 Tax=Streptomyces sp. MS06 TaxID=3385974 RepID=UPI0039A24CEE
MRDLGAGLGHLLNGQRWVARHGRRYAFGLLPALIALLFYTAALTVLALRGADLVAWATPFADGWTDPWAGLFRRLLTVVLFALGLLLSVVTFTAVTLLVGQPFYESLSAAVDRDVSPDGTAPASGLPLWRELWVSARDGLRIVVRAGLWGLLLFALGFLPVVGQTAVPVIGVFVTGFFLTEELTAVALQRRGVDLRARLALLRSRKLLVWGFGAPLALAFLVPFVAVLLMPGAVAGATLLARGLRGEETADRPVRPEGADEAPSAEAPGTTPDRPVPPGTAPDRPVPDLPASGR